MASNEIPKNYTGAVALAEDAADGAQTHGAAIGLKQNTGGVIRADLDALTAAEETAALKRTAKASAAGANKTADSNGKAFIARFIQLEKPRIGSSWGPLWQEAGFSAGSISMPGTQGERFVLLGEIKKFLHNHPECVITDVARPDLDVTEAVAAALYLATSAARTGVNDKTNESSAAATARETALDTIRRRLGGLRDELSQLPLPGDSPLWYAFGFNRPNDPATPGTPENLVLAAGAAGTGTLIVDWNPARRATGYRVKIQVPGEPQPRTFGLFADDQTTLTGLPSGVVLTATVIGHNESGDGPASSSASITLN
ncbi:MAG: fibronectin type III domain-containing protein [Luteolibacter sp.]|uniref:fibronectin type III domain-containing protein n=1 Tax=Luteolibacter sp. TaxID=1962973 RepID=UPI0032668DA1